MRSSIDAILAESDVLVVTNASPSFQQVLESASTTHHIVDLVGTLQPCHKTSTDSYHGICW